MPMSADAAKLSEADKVALKQATVACKAEMKDKKISWILVASQLAGFDSNGAPGGCPGSSLTCLSRAISAWPLDGI